MNEKIKQHLTDYAISKGLSTSDETLFEIVREAKELSREKISSHRWYDDHFVVVHINNMLIGYDDFYMTGDNSPSDMGLDYNYDSLCEVKPVEKTIIVYEKVI